MKKKFLTASISLTIIVILVFANLFFIAPNHVANAASKETIYLFMDDPNHPLNDTYSIITNKQIGIFVDQFDSKDYSIVFTDSTENDKTTYGTYSKTTLFPMKNSVTYTVYFFNRIILAQIPIMYVTYDLQKPYISATTNKSNIGNGEVVIGQSIEVKAHDNLTDLKMYLSKDDAPTMLCEGVTYEIIEDGTYTFHAVDVAGNYSDDFTITYYKQEPIKEPDVPTIPDEPITPTNPITPEEPIINNENTTAQDGGIIAIVVIIGIVIVGIVVIVVYRKIKTQLTHYDDFD